MLKKIRIVFSTILILLFIFVFLEIKEIPTLSHLLAITQFIPSLLLFLSDNFSFLATGFLIVLVLTVLFGRVYCSFLCPLGILQDFIIFIKNKIKKPVRKYEFNFKYVRYFILLLTFIFVVFKLNSLTGIFDPYANFGRISANLIKPVFNFFAGIFLNINTEIHHINKILLFYSLLFFVFLILLTIFKNRLYCNTLCPVGALLSIISKISFFKIQINNNCIKCGLCEINCKANCIDVKEGIVDNERCVRCFNCIDNCKKFAINFSYIKINEKEDEQRRNIIKSFLILSLLALFDFLKVNKIFAKEIEYKKKNPLITPPGSKSLKNFNEKCISCHLCVSSCPTRVLTPSVFEYGILCIFQPKMDYSKSYCLYECNICSKVCPTGAIQPLTLNEKKTTQIGIARYIMENCVVVNKETNCGVCNEYCPTKAVKLVPYKNDLFIPSVNKNICIGCGACEFVCPASPYKAIVVEGNKNHLIAQLPGLQKRKRKGQKNDF